MTLEAREYTQLGRMQAASAQVSPRTSIFGQLHSTLYVNAVRVSVCSCTVLQQANQQRDQSKPLCPPSVAYDTGEPQLPAIPPVQTTTKEWSSLQLCLTADPERVPSMLFLHTYTSASVAGRRSDRLRASPWTLPEPPTSSW